MMRFLTPLFLSGSLLFVSCQKEAAEVAIDPEFERAQQELADLRSELASLEARMVEQANAVQRKEAEQAELLREMKDLISELQPPKAAKQKTARVEPLEEAEKPASNSTARTRARLEVQGEKLASLETLSGDQYEDLVINRVTDIGINFRHRGGIARVPFEELPVAMQERFYYDPERAVEALKAERIAQARYEKASAARLAAKEEREEQKKLQDSLARLEEAVRDLGRQAAVAPQPQAPPIIADPAPRRRQDIFVNQPPIFIPNQVVPNRPFCPPGGRQPLVCPPVVRPPLVRPPVIRQPVRQVRPAITRPACAVTPARSAVVRPHRVIRRSGRTAVTPTQRIRPTIQRAR